MLEHQRHAAESFDEESGREQLKEAVECADPEAQQEQRRHQRAHCRRALQKGLKRRHHSASHTNPYSRTLMEITATPIRHRLRSTSGSTSLSKISSTLFRVKPAKHNPLHKS